MKLRRARVGGCSVTLGPPWICGCSRMKEWGSVTHLSVGDRGCDNARSRTDKGPAPIPARRAHLPRRLLALPESITLRLGRIVSLASSASNARFETSTCTTLVVGHHDGIGFALVPAAPEAACIHRAANPFIRHGLSLLLT